MGFFGYIVLMVVGMIISGTAAFWVRSSYKKYSKQMSASGLTGAQTARMILDRNNLTNVQVEPVAGSSPTTTTREARRCGSRRVTLLRTPSLRLALRPTSAGTRSRTLAATCR